MGSEWEELQRVLGSELTSRRVTNGKNLRHLHVQRARERSSDKKGLAFLEKKSARGLVQEALYYLIANRAQRGESTSAAPAANFFGITWSKRLRRSQIEAIFLPSLLLFLFFSPPPPFFSFFCGARLFSTFQKSKERRGTNISGMRDSNVGVNGE